MADLHELAAFFALDALDPDERQAFERHLLGCEQCQVEISELSAGVGVLARATAEPAPEDMRAVVLGRIDADPESRLATVAALPRRGWLAGVAAVAAATTIVLAVLFVGLQTRLGEAERVQTVVAAADLQILTAADSPVGPARFAYSAQLGQGVFTGSGLPALGTDQTYELWLIGTEGPSPAGIFLPGEDGTAVVLVTGDLDTGVTLGLTVEPQGGSNQPTGEVLIALPLD